MVGAVDDAISEGDLEDFTKGYSGQTGSGKSPLASKIS
jgi:hypothetical protein